MVGTAPLANVKNCNVTDCIPKPNKDEQILMDIDRWFDGRKDKKGARLRQAESTFWLARICFFVVLQQWLQIPAKNA